MFVQGNLRGFGIFIISGIVVAIGYFLLKLPDVAVMIAGGITLIAVDLVLRLLKKNEKGWLMSKNFGGYLYFAPVWVFGIIVIIINIINFFVKK
jgi:hypothetical protein